MNSVTEYEILEMRVEQIDKEVTALYNEISELTWIDKDYKKKEVRKIQGQIDRLMDEKYEIINLLN